MGPPWGPFSRTFLAAALALPLALPACGSNDPQPCELEDPSLAAPTRDDAILADLRRFEASRRAAADFEHAPPSDHLFGPDPYAVRALPGGRFLGLLRGADAVVLLAPDLTELARAPAPASASGLALDRDRVFLVGERESRILELRLTPTGLPFTRDIPLPGVRTLRDVAAGPGGVLHAVSEAPSTLFTLVPDPRAPTGFDVTSTPVPAGAFRVARTATAVLVASLVAHTVAAYPLDPSGRPVGPPVLLTNDGPLWTFAALEEPGALLVATAGAEDLPLDRTHGSFENIDSFLYVDRLSWPPTPKTAASPGAPGGTHLPHVSNRPSPGAPTPHPPTATLATPPGAPAPAPTLHPPTATLATPPGAPAPAGAPVPATRIAEVNLSEHGVVLPKALALTRTATGLQIIAAAHGSPAFATVFVPDAPNPPSVATRPIPPGTTAFARDDHGTWILANSLLDAWIRLEAPAMPTMSATPVSMSATPVSMSATPVTMSATPVSMSAAPRSISPTPPSMSAAPRSISPTPPSMSAAPRSISPAPPPAAPALPVIVPVPDPRRAERTAASRLGEALIFTTLIAPWNRAAGPLSRFTCETCHFEGYADGRAHATGRGEVRATTRPLLGLFNNRPHFSRALDPDLSAVAHAEFRVAGARSDHDPIFDASLADAPWLAALGLEGADLSAVAMRRAFMTFLMEWSHRASPFTAGRSAWTPLERRGAELFRDHCETCHEARLQSDVPTSRAPFDTWERHLFSEAGPLVWGQARYAKTGPSPYVHEEGARISSLRRLFKKAPYFTTGAAPTLADVLARVRLGQPTFFHDKAPPDPSLRPLTPEERAALEAFLLLL